MSNFLLGPEALFKLKLAKFDAPTEAIAAKLTVKKCTDQIALDNRLRITKILVIIFFFCLCEWEFLIILTARNEVSLLLYGSTQHLLWGSWLTAHCLLGSPVQQVDAT